MVWFKLVNVNKKYNIIMKAILYFVWTNPPFFELSGVSLLLLGNQRIMSPIEKFLIL